MKIIKTALGWEIQPEDKQEMAHVRWLLDRLVADQVSDNELPCPRCSTFGNYDGRACLACGFNYRHINEVIRNPLPEVRTFTTKGAG